ncbi:MAG: glycosyltransferase family 4 protein [Bacteroidia bacterium]
MKVIFCTDGIFPHDVGGMQRHSRFLAEYLAKSGKVELTVIHPHPENVFESALGITELRIQPIDKKKNYLLECYRYSKRVNALLLQYPEHIVYSQGLSVWSGIKKVAPRLIVNPHGLEPYQAISGKDKAAGIPFRMIFNYIFSNAARVVSLGGKLTNILEKNIKNTKKIIELPNAVVLPPVNPKVFNQQIRCLFVGRFAGNKGIHILIEAIKQLNEEGYGDKMIFNLGGKGPLFEHYSTSSQYPNLNYLGFISDEQLFELYRSNDLFVLPTLFEGMPTVVLEAMSYGMPVIVSDVGATSVQVDVSNGYLIRRNDVDVLKDALKKFYALDASQKEKMSEASRRKIEKQFTWEKVAEAHVQEFLKLAAAK